MDVAKPSHMKQVTLLAALILAFTALFAQVEKPVKYTAHEWGTFTTVHGSDGGYLSGLYREEEHLPNFVYSHNGFSPDPAVQKGLYKEAAAVTVKMETPVVYFYSDRALDVNIKVDFPNGAISQWYPKRLDGEANPINKELDFSTPYEGWITWDATILDPSSDLAINTNPLLETPTWIRPRETDANLVQCGEEIEKFLFYRGVGNFKLPLHLEMVDDQTLSLINKGNEDISYVFVYEKWGNQPAKVWWTGELETEKKLELRDPGESLSKEGLDASFEEFVQALVDAGLYEKEARAMLNTWHESYFNSYGIKVFWVVPSQLTEEILPLTLDPKPENLERVLVGRSEILSPSFEKEVAKDIRENPMGNRWIKDRYYLAYQERAEQLLTVNASTQPAYDPMPSGHTMLFPNPAENTINIVTEDIGYTEFQISNASGTIVLEGPAVFVRGSMSIDIQSLEPGVYHFNLLAPKGIETPDSHPFVVVR